MKRKEPVKKYRNSPESRRIGKQQVENLREVAEKKEKTSEGKGEKRENWNNTRLKRTSLSTFFSIGHVT